MRRVAPKRAQLNRAATKEPRRKPRHFKFRVNSGWNMPFHDVEVRVEVSERNQHGLTYAAFVGPLKVGTIEKRMARFERRSEGKRYVNSRWHSLRFFACQAWDSDARLCRFDCQTISQAAKLLAEEYMRRQWGGW
jgi:hypothetical protein